MPRQPGQPEIVQGRNAVREALRSGRGRRLLLDAHASASPALEEILRLAAARGLPLERLERHDLARRLGGAPYQGIALSTEPRALPSLEEILDACEAQGVAPCLLLLKEVLYDQNLGAILRLADACGVQAVIVPSRQGAGVSAEVARVSAGASEYVPVLRQSLLQAISRLRRRGVRLIAAEAGASQALWDCDLTGPLALVLGGEDAGVSQAILDRCDAVVRIPIGGHIGSLNVAAACAVALFERQRQLRDGAGLKRGGG
jgi:23S rRNA (guanosine2251-2'-O)-methyltransferase